MEERDLAAVVVTHNSAPLLPGTLAALEAELAGAPGARRLVVDSASSDGGPALARARGWEVLELDPAAALTPAAAREAARRACRARQILFVDGDVAVEPGFLAAAVARLDADPNLAGVGGELRFDEGRGAPAAVSAAPRAVPLLAALSLYRADALERAGGFVPWLESEEDADLGLRLRRAGGGLLQQQPGGIHRSGPRRSFGETLRRLRAGLYYGQGRVLRLRFGSDLFGATVRRQALYLGVIGFWLAVLLASLAEPAALAGAAAVLVLAAAGMAARKRGLGPGLLSVVTWHVMAWGLLVGLLTPPRSREVRVRPGGGGAE